MRYKRSEEPHRRTKLLKILKAGAPMLSAALSVSGCIADTSVVGSAEALAGDSSASQAATKSPSIGAPGDLITMNHKAAIYDDGFGGSPGDLITMNHKAAIYDDGFNDTPDTDKTEADATEAKEPVAADVVSDPKEI